MLRPVQLVGLLLSFSHTALRSELFWPCNPAIFPAMYFPSLVLLASACMAAAKEIVITVGGPSNTTNGSTTFMPQRVVAGLGDVVTFNFTTGNHTATESTFDNPCIPAHETDASINGFDSGPRSTQPGTSGSILAVPIIIQNVDHTFWFYDTYTCGEGGVGVINNNESSGQTLAGFERNAIRLNGTKTSNATSTSYRLSPTSPPSPSTSPHKSATNRAFTVGAIGAIPLFIATLFL